jgi:hypothetical protein
MGMLIKLWALNHKTFDCGLTQRPVKSEKSIVTTFVVRRPWKHVIGRYTVDVTNSYLVDHGFNWPILGQNFIANTEPDRERTQKFGKYSRIVGNSGLVVEEIIPVDGTKSILALMPNAAVIHYQHYLSVVRYLHKTCKSLQVHENISTLHPCNFAFLLNAGKWSNSSFTSQMIYYM